MATTSRDVLRNHHDVDSSLLPSSITSSAELLVEDTANCFFQAGPIFKLGIIGDQNSPPGALCDSLDTTKPLPSTPSTRSFSLSLEAPTTPPMNHSPRDVGVIGEPQIAHNNSAPDLHGDLLRRFATSTTFRRPQYPSSVERTAPWDTVAPSSFSSSGGAVNRTLLGINGHFDNTMTLSQSPSPPVSISSSTPNAPNGTPASSFAGLTMKSPAPLSAAERRRDLEIFAEASEDNVFGDNAGFPTKTEGLSSGFTFDQEVRGGVINSAAAVASGAAGRTDDGREKMLGQWICATPPCNARNFYFHEQCISCKSPRHLSTQTSPLTVKLGHHSNPSTPPHSASSNCSTFSIASSPSSCSSSGQSPITPVGLWSDLPSHTRPNTNATSAELSSFSSWSPSSAHFTQKQLTSPAHSLQSSATRKAASTTVYSTPTSLPATTLQRHGSIPDYSTSPLDNHRSRGVMGDGPGMLSHRVAVMETSPGGNVTSVLNTRTSTESTFDARFGLPNPPSYPPNQRQAQQPLQSQLHSAFTRSGADLANTFNSSPATNANRNDSNPQSVTSFATLQALLTPSGNALALGGRIQNISGDDAYPILMFWPDNERLPFKGQVRPANPSYAKVEGRTTGPVPLGAPTPPPIMNTGNQGPMAKQALDWECLTCGYVNWRRRKVCQMCYPYAAGNEPPSSQAGRTHAITSLLSAAHAQQRRDEASTDFTNGRSLLTPAIPTRSLAYPGPTAGASYNPFGGSASLSNGTNDRAFSTERVARGGDLSNESMLSRYAGARALGDFDTALYEARARAIAAGHLPAHLMGSNPSPSAGVAMGSSAQSSWKPSGSLLPTTPSLAGNTVWSQGSTGFLSQVPSATRSFASSGSAPARDDHSRIPRAYHAGQGLGFSPSLGGGMGQTKSHLPQSYASTNSFACHPGSPFGLSLPNTDPVHYPLTSSSAGWPSSNSKSHVAPGTNASRSLANKWPHFMGLAEPTPRRPAATNPPSFHYAQANSNDSWPSSMLYSTSAF